MALRHGVSIQCIVSWPLLDPLDCLCEFDYANGIRPVVERKSFGAWIHIESPSRIQIGAGGIKAALDHGRHSAFDLDGP